MMPKKTENIAFGTGRAVDARQVLDGESEKEKILQHLQHQAHGIGKGMDALKHHHENHTRDGGKKDMLEPPPPGSVRLEKQTVQLPLKLAVVKKPRQGAEEPSE